MFYIGVYCGVDPSCRVCLAAHGWSFISAGHLTDLSIAPQFGSVSEGSQLLVVEKLSCSSLKKSYPKKPNPRRESGSSPDSFPGQICVSVGFLRLSVTLVDWNPNLTPKRMKVSENGR